MNLRMQPIGNDLVTLVDAELRLPVLTLTVGQVNEGGTHIRAGMSQQLATDILAGLKLLRAVRSASEA